MTTSRFKVPFFGRKCGGPAPRRAERATPRSIFDQKKIGAVLACLAGPLVAQEVAVPSGAPMMLYDVRLEVEPQEVARFRFVSAAIDPAGEGRTFGDLVDDLQFICEQVVVPSLAANDWAGEAVVISVSSRETEFGVYDDSITQFFQPYRIADGACMWEEF